MELIDSGTDVSIISTEAWPPEWYISPTLIELGSKSFKMIKPNYSVQMKKT